MLSKTQDVLQAGFNAGDGVQFFKVNVSLTPDVVNIDKMSNVRIPGVFVFGVDKSEVMKPCEVERKETQMIFFYSMKDLTVIMQTQSMVYHKKKVLFKDTSRRHNLKKSTSHYFQRFVITKDRITYNYACILISFRRSDGHP